MGIGSNLMVELQEQRYLEEKTVWIQAQLDNSEADEFSEGWDELSDEYDKSYATDDEQDFYGFENWTVKGKTKIFINHL